MERPPQETFDWLDEHTTLRQLAVRAKHRALAACTCALHSSDIGERPRPVLTYAEIKHLYPVGIIVWGRMTAKFSDCGVGGALLFFKVTGYDAKGLPVLEQLCEHTRAWETISGCQFAFIIEPVYAEPAPCADDTHSNRTGKRRIEPMSARMHGAELMLNRRDNPIRCQHRNKVHLRPWTGKAWQTHSYPQ